MYYSNRKIDRIYFKYKYGDRIIDDIWRIIVYCKSKKLDEYNRVDDLDGIEKYIYARYDGVLLDCQPTMEIVAKDICEHCINCYKVEICSFDDRRNLIYVEDEN